MRYGKIAFVMLIISIISIIIGYFLWTILLPVQDLNMMSLEEIQKLQKEVAVNYELGRGMMWTGICGIGVSVFLFLKK